MTTATNDYFTTTRNRLLAKRYAEKVKALGLKGDWWNQLTLDADDMRVVISVVPDEDGDTTWLGTFDDTEGDVINPNWYYSEYGRCDSYKWYTDEATSVEELASYYNGHIGMPKHDARLAAIKSIQGAAKMAAANEQYGVVVTVEIDGVEVGSASVWGNTLESEAEVWSVVEDCGLIDEAIADLGPEIERLTDRLAKLTAIKSRVAAQ